VRRALVIVWNRIDDRDVALGFIVGDSSVAICRARPSASKLSSANSFAQSDQQVRLE
jgi:hypothetical protein